MANMNRFDIPLGLNASILPMTQYCIFLKNATNIGFLYPAKQVFAGGLATSNVGIKCYILPPNLFIPDLMVIRLTWPGVIDFRAFRDH